MALQRQKIAKRPVILEVRPLTKADLARLPAKREENGIVQRLRSHHHRVARLDAAGLKPQEICELCAISHQRLYTMRASPAYQELVATYRATVDAAFERAQDTYARAAISNMVRAEDQIADHLDEAEEKGELLPLSQLVKITSDRADRFGYPKGTIVAKVSVGDALEKAMLRSGRTIVVDAKVSPALAPPGEGGDTSSSLDPSPEQAQPHVSRRGF